MLAEKKKEHEPKDCAGAVLHKIDGRNTFWIHSKYIRMVMYAQHQSRTKLGKINVACKDVPQTIYIVFVVDNGKKFPQR